MLDSYVVIEVDARCYRIPLVANWIYFNRTVDRYVLGDPEDAIVVAARGDGVLRPQFVQHCIYRNLVLTRHLSRQQESDELPRIFAFAYQVVCVIIKFFQAVRLLREVIVHGVFDE
jgi:hypothetical protein